MDADDTSGSTRALVAQSDTYAPSVVDGSSSGLLTYADVDGNVKLGDHMALVLDAGSHADIFDDYS